MSRRSGDADRSQSSTAGAKVVGVPGASTRAQYTAAVHAYRDLPVRYVAALNVVVAALIALTAYSLGYAPLTAAGTVLAVGVGGYAASKFPRVLATGLVLAGFSVFMVPLSMLYAANVNGASGDASGPVATMAVTMLLAAYLAHRTSRGRPWVTVLIVAAAVSVVGPVFLLSTSGVGFAAAWVVTGVVLWLRGGGTAWLLDQWENLTAVASRRRASELDLPEPVRLLGEKSEAEERTGAHLADLPGGYVVFHDRYLPAPKHSTSPGEVVNHVVVGPTGVFVVGSHRFKGRVIEDRAKGLVHRGNPLAGLFNDSRRHARRVNEVLGVKNLHAVPVVVIHDAVLPQPRLRVALSVDDRTVGDVTVLSGSQALCGEVTAPPPTLTPRQVTRLARKVGRRLPPVPRSVLDEPVGGITGVVVDTDGHPHVVEDAEPARPMFETDRSGVRLVNGDEVSVLTTQGTFTGYRVAGTPRRHDGGLMHVPLLNEADWVRAAQSDPAGVEQLAETWFPLDSVQPVGPH